MKDTTTALADAKGFDNFITTQFATVEVGDQIYYIANKSKASKTIELLKSDDSSVRDAFITKMGAVMVDMGGKKYPAIATRDAILGNYKTVENKDSLKNAVAFDAKQYDKVLKNLKDVQAPAADVASGLANRFIQTVQSNPEQAKADLKKAIVGNDPRENTALENLLRADFTNPLIDWTNPKIADKLKSVITDILNKKSSAFVMNDTGIAFDGVSLVPGSLVRGKIEGKNPSEGFYEVKSSSVAEFAKEDTTGNIAKVLNAANDK